MRCFSQTLLLVTFLYVPLVSAVVVNENAISHPAGEWLSYGRDYKEHRYSPLDSINRDTVKELDLAWSFKFDTARAMEATPLVHNGVIYVSTAWSHVHAIDARTGKQIWHYDSAIDKAHLIKTCCGPNNRGVALWQSGGGEDDGGQAPLQVFFGALDGRLIALDAATGKQNWSVQTTPTDGNYSITGAPRVVKGMVIIGNSGAELGVRGFVSAYDAITGEQRWRFYTVPGDRNKPQEHPDLDSALSTWSGDYWYQNGGGGGTVWDSIVYDRKLDLLYIGTGNGSPWNREVRSPGGGDNLYLSSIVALKPDTGEYVWHYQVTPKENWDYTATQHMVLAELEIDGQLRDVIMQAPKNGFFYVLDRHTGELLSAEPYANITWASHVDMTTGRPVETKYADYQNNGVSFLWPGPLGAHNWQPMSYSNKTGLMYIPVQNVPSFYKASEKVVYAVGLWNTGIDLNVNRDFESWIAVQASTDALVYGELVAWDPVKKKRVWQVRHRYVANGGVLSTGGDLVFQGTKEGKFAAYDAFNGERLWEYHSDSAILAGPISYELDGEQYIAVAQGGGGGGMLAIGENLKLNRVNQNRLLVFKKGQFNYTNKLTQASDEPGLATIVELGHEASTDPELIHRGSQIYERNCSMCHGIGAKGGGVVPDLRYMSEQTHTEFVAIVFGGVRSHKGMVGFNFSLDLEEVNAIHAYLDHEQQRLPSRVKMSFWQKIEYRFVYAIAKLGERFPEIINFIRDE